MKKALFLLTFLAISIVATASTQVLKSDNFKSGLGSWNSPNYWAGKLSLAQEEGKNCLLLESETRGNRTFARAYGIAKRVDFYPGMHLRLTVTAKGSGKFIASILRYSWGNGKPDYTPAEEKE